jgi:TetR/AcrR family transcriptional repressor of nem operon
MSAPRKFNEIEVVERAMLCFWRLGYEGCSISDLVATTGLKRQGIYNTFGSKEGLFERALALYRQRVDESLVPLEAEAAGVEELEAYFRNFLALQEKLGVGACLMVQTAYSPAMSSAPIRLAVHASAQRVRDAFALLLHRMLDNAGRKPSFDCIAQAAELYALLNGLSALAATGTDRRLIDRSIERAIKQLVTSFRPLT